MPKTRQLRALVLRAPGINCDRETAQACRLVGFRTELVHINQLLQDPDSLLSYHFLVLPGGFSYGDDLGAGTLLAKNLAIHLGRQLHQFVEEGRPVLGICNGFQVLVRLGLLPGEEGRDGADVLVGEGTRVGVSPTPTATLTENESAQFECRWVTLAVQASPCIFTRGIERPIELPVAHGEGQFVFSGRDWAIETIPLVYMTPERSKQSAKQQSQTVNYPDNPNGSVGNIAGICNIHGNVFGLMPHPERYVSALQHPLRRNVDGGFAPPYDGQGDGLLLFKNAYAYLAGRGRGEGAVGTGSAQGTIPTAPVREMVAHGDQADQNRPATRLRTGACREGACPLPVPTEESNNLVEVDGLAPVQEATPGSMAPARSSYAASGVDIAAGEQAVNLMKAAVSSTQGPEVLAGIGAFAGVFSAKNLYKMRRPAIVASTDGVGTKSLLAAQAGRYDTIGYDIVNHSINDLLMQGAKPLFFMDYIAMGKLDPVAVATIVKGIANACREAGCALLGGETAEMPDVYMPGAFDLAGTIVGLVEEDEIINGSTISPGDVLLGLPSNGLHTNGYSLARRVFAPHTFDTVFPELGEPLINALLRPHRSYLKEIVQLKDYLADRGRYIKGMAHITGGGFAGNISRILPAGTQAAIDTGAWSMPPLFQLIARLGGVPQAELYQTFNMGIGVVIILAPKAAMDARCILPSLITIGGIQEGNGVVLQ
jgi:phosphoribosylformylglycinamidine synthase I